MVEVQWKYIRWTLTVLLLTGHFCADTGAYSMSVKHRYLNLYIFKKIYIHKSMEALDCMLSEKVFL